MSEPEFTPTQTDERNEVVRLKAQLAKAETVANEAEVFGKFDVTVPNVGEDTYESYLDKRPQDGIIRDNDSFRNTENGQFTSAQEYNADKNNDNRTPQSVEDYYHNLMESDNKPYEEKDFESLGLKQLVFEMAKAEKLGDKALSMEIQDTMSSRLTDLAEKEGWTSKQKDEQAETLLAQVLKLSSGGENEVTPSIDAMADNNEVSDDSITGEDEDAIRLNAEPAFDGESAEEYEKRNNIDTHEDVVVNPATDTLTDVVLSPVGGEQASGSDLSSDDSEKDNNNQETSDDDKLDEEKQSIWNRASGHASNLAAKAAAIFSTTLYTAGNFMPKPKSKPEETKEQFEARVKRYGAAKIVGVVALIVAAKYGLPLLNGGEAHASGAGSGAGAEAVDTAASGGSKVEVDPSLFSAEAHTVTRGEGWYQTLKEMGITNETEQANLLQKLGPQLQARGWAYPMEGGSWGISHTGQLPENVLKLIKNSR